MGASDNVSSNYRDYSDSGTTKKEIKQGSSMYLPNASAN